MIEHTHLRKAAAALIKGYPYFQRMVSPRAATDNMMQTANNAAQESERLEGPAKRAPEFMQRDVNDGNQKFTPNTNVLR